MRFLGLPQPPAQAWTPQAQDSIIRPMAKARYIAVDGPIGVGKTILSKDLAARLKADLVRDLAADNPFLGRFLRNRNSFAFQTQIFYLLHRYQQQKRLLQADLFYHGTVMDYLFARDPIYALISLSDEEQALYKTLFDTLSERAPKPDLAVYLRASADVLFDRIHKGDGPFYRFIGRSFLEEAIRAYDNFFFYYSDSPLLVVDTSQLDLHNSAEDRDHLIDVINKMKSSGTEHYIPVRDNS